MKSRICHLDRQRPAHPLRLAVSHQQWRLFMRQRPGPACRPPLRNENPRCRTSVAPGSTPARLGALEPVRQRGAGTCGTVHCCCERVGQTHPWEVPSGRHVNRRPKGAGDGCDGGAVRGSRRASRRRRGDRPRPGDRPSPLGPGDPNVSGDTRLGSPQLAGWLAEFGVTLVGMEATGVYWKTVFQALEDRFECWLLNAHHLRNVPGRKTDVKDSEWICQLVQHGLVRPSFVPPPEIRRLRDLTRLRTAQTNERARTIQRLEKVLQDAGIKLSSVASHTYSKSARAMLEALLSRRHRPRQLAELAKARMRTKIPQLREALASRFTIEHHGVMVAQLLAHIDTLDAALQNLTRTDRARARTARPHHRVAVHDPRRSGPSRAGPDRRVRPRHDRVPDRRALRLLGRSVPRPSPISRPPALGTNPPRPALADRRAHRMRPGRRPHQGHLPRRPLRAAPRTAR